MAKTWFLNKSKFIFSKFQGFEPWDFKPVSVFDWYITPSTRPTTSSHKEFIFLKNKKKFLSKNNETLSEIQSWANLLTKDENLKG